MAAALHCSTSLASPASAGQWQWEEWEECFACLVFPSQSFLPLPARPLLTLSMTFVFSGPLGGRDTALGALCIILIRVPAEGVQEGAALPPWLPLLSLLACAFPVLVLGLDRDRLQRFPWVTE